MYQFSTHVFFELSTKDEIGQHRKGRFSRFSCAFCHQNVYENRNSNLCCSPLFLRIHIQVDAPHLFCLHHMMEWKHWSISLRQHFHVNCWLPFNKYQQENNCCHLLTISHRPGTMPKAMHALSQTHWGHWGEGWLSHWVIMRLKWAKHSKFA